MESHEATLLACMQASPDMAAAAASILRSVDFIAHEHQVIFATFQDLLRDGVELASVSLPAILAEDGHEEDVVQAAQRLGDSDSRGAECMRLVLESSVRRAVEA